MDWQPVAVGTVSALQATVQSILAMDARTSWPMLAHMTVSDYVVSAASGGMLPEELAGMLRRHRLEMVYYAAAPDGNGISPAYHSYRPAASKARGGGIKAIGYWYGCLLTMLSAHATETASLRKKELEGKAAKAAAALSHFCADLSSPVHTASEEAVHGPYETWLKNIFARRDSDPRYRELYQSLQGQIRPSVRPVRKLLADVPAAAESDLAAAAHGELAALCALWAARQASGQTFSPVDGDLIALTARRFADGASFTADVWYTAFAQRGEPLPPFNPYLYKLCPDYEQCLARLEAQVATLVAQG